MPSTERSEGQARRPLLHWTEIKNLLRLHSLTLRHNLSYGMDSRVVSRWHYLWAPNGLIGLANWRHEPDPQAFIMARIAHAAWRRDNAR